MDEIEKKQRYQAALEEAREKYTLADREYQ